MTKNAFFLNFLTKKESGLHKNQPQVEDNKLEQHNLQKSSINSEDYNKALDDAAHIVSSTKDYKQGKIVLGHCLENKSVISLYTNFDKLSLELQQRILTNQEIHCNNLMKNIIKSNDPKLFESKIKSSLDIIYAKQHSQEFGIGNYSHLGYTKFNYTSFVENQGKSSRNLHK